MGPLTMKYAVRLLLFIHENKEGLIICKILKRNKLEAPALVLGSNIRYDNKTCLYRPLHSSISGCTLQNISTV